MRDDPVLDPDRPVVACFRSPVFNASETFVQAQAAGLERYQPLVVGLEDKGHVVPELEQRRLLASTGERLAVRWLGYSESLARRVERLAPVLVHAQFGPDGLLALPLARALGVPLVTTLHGFEIGRSRAAMLRSGRLSWMRYALFQQRLMQTGDLFLAVSERLRQQAAAQGYPSDRTFTHYLGVDLDRFDGTMTEREPGLILHVGRLVEKKGTMLLLRAFAELRGKMARPRLAVIGDGPERGRLERRSRALGLGDAVSFLGALPHAEVATWMRRASVLAVPSVTAGDGDAEGLPTVLVEAAASALPAVGTNHGGIPEAIIDGETGVVVPERDPAALVAGLGALLASDDLRRRMGQAARRMAEQLFDAAGQARLLEQRYDSLLRQTRP